MRAGGQIQGKLTKLNHPEKQPLNLASSDRDMFIDSAKLVHPAHVNYENERGQNNKPFSKTNPHMK